MNKENEDEGAGAGAGYLLTMDKLHRAHSAGALTLEQYLAAVAACEARYAEAGARLTPKAQHRGRVKPGGMP